MKTLSTTEPVALPARRVAGAAGAAQVHGARSLAMAGNNARTGALQRLQLLADQAPGATQLGRQHAVMSGHAGPLSAAAAAPVQRATEPDQTVLPDRLNSATGARAGAPDSSGATAPVVQRLMNVPFKAPDARLVNFMNEHGAGMAAGDKATGKYTKKVAADEDIVLIGHGNGTSLVDQENDVKEWFGPSELAGYLAGILPRDYTGTITVWSCQSATPYKHLKTYNDKRDAGKADLSFIKILQLWLDSLNIGFEGMIRGAIGFVTMDRRYDRARVYEDEVMKMLGNNRDYEEGFVTSKETPDERFYQKESDDDEEDGSFGASSFSGSSSEEEMVEDEPVPVEPQPVTTVTLKWLNIHKDVGGIKVNAQPSHFFGQTVVAILAEQEGMYHVRIVSTANAQLAQSVGHQGWMKKEWVTNAL